MQQANKNAAFLALDTYADAGPALVKALKAAGYSTVEDARALVVEWAGKRAKCPLIKSEHHLSKTSYVLDSTHAKYETARKAVSRVMVALKGKDEGEKQVSRKSEPVKLSRNESAAWKAFVELVGADRAQVIAKAMKA